MLFYTMTCLIYSLGRFNCQDSALFGDMVAVGGHVENLHQEDTCLSLTDAEWVKFITSWRHSTWRHSTRGSFYTALGEFYATLPVIQLACLQVALCEFRPGKKLLPTES